ncbi:hypothetical protein BC940DRAFT_290337 [Gongronella butleri]|nr:hypothetical protein BC940DRAFT_290337 [Gongronella butleri]
MGRVLVHCSTHMELLTLSSPNWPLLLLYLCGQFTAANDVNQAHRLRRRVTDFMQIFQEPGLCLHMITAFCTIADLVPMATLHFFYHLKVETLKMQARIATPRHKLW